MITLLTDFGLIDTYVGVMKGVIAQIAPQETVIDLSHGIPPQDCRQASFQLVQALPHFPRGTIHVVVVDPGVGSDRRAVAIKYHENEYSPSSYLVGPDNGVFTSVLGSVEIIHAVELTCTDYWYAHQRNQNAQKSNEISATFHGRDTFAPVAAHLATGVPIQNFGPAIAPSSLIKLPYLDYERIDNGWRGWVQSIDHFGNIITTIPGDCLKDWQPWQIQIAGETIQGQHSAYYRVPRGCLLSLIGSHGFIEIAVNGGSAQQILALSLNPPPEVFLQSSC